MKGVGRVYLVGAGPGDPGLITVRGQECLSVADVVLYDGLANDQLLQMAPGAECLCVGKHGQSPIWTQAEINRKLLELAAQGKCVVRLKGGDPAVFARTAEELEVLAAAGVPFEVVPGITAALAAASYVGIPITHRQHASAVALITAQQQSGGARQSIHWEALARFPGTIVFYMGVTTVADWTSKLLGAGKAAQTPVAIIRRCTWSDQSVVRCSLGEVADQLSPATRMRPPVIVIVGEVASLGADFDWFTTRPLHGRGVLVTRPEHQADELTGQLRHLGAEVFHQPVIQITPPSDWNSVDRALQQLVHGDVHGITFSSSNGVDGFLRRLAELEYDARVFSGVRIAAVGPATAARLKAYCLRADVVPGDSQEFSAPGLLERLGDTVAGEKWIVTGTNRSRDRLTEGLQRCGATTLAALSYETHCVDKRNPSITRAIQARRIQFVTITSSFIAEAAYQLLADYRDQLQPISMSRVISDSLASLNWPAAVQADQNTAHALTQALLLHCQQSSHESKPPESDPPS